MYAHTVVGFIGPEYLYAGGRWAVGSYGSYDLTL